MDDTKPYDVGYGKPPVQTRFAKGSSGNPRGRPKKVKDGAAPETTLQRLLKAPYARQREDGSTRILIGQEALLRATLTNALKGSVKATDRILRWEQRLVQEQLQSRAVRAIDPGQPAALLLVPQIALSSEEWEAEAMPSQARLAQETRQGI